MEKRKARQSVEQIAEKDGRYHPNAVKFLYEGLAYTVREQREEQDPDQPHHVTGQQLCDGLAGLATERWGRLAKTVLNHWGIKTTRDFGEIVYLMIENNLMSKKPEDSIEDFMGVYDFEDRFRKQFRF